MGRKRKSLNICFLTLVLSKRFGGRLTRVWIFPEVIQQSFNEWFGQWLKEAPDRKMIQDSIIIMLSLWCACNDAVFKMVTVNVDNVVRCFSGLMSLCRSVRSKGEKDAVREKGRSGVNQSLFFFCFKKEELGEEQGDCAPFVTDGTWVESRKMGASAWVRVATREGTVQQSAKCNASSATTVENYAGLVVLQWAMEARLDKICIKTDCAVLVQGLDNLESAPFHVRPALIDFLSLCKNVPTQMVKKLPITWLRQL